MSVADLSSIEKMKLEKILEMNSGYVLDFSNRTFYEFVVENTGLDIYDDKYEYASGSKANRLRSFWDQEPNGLVGRVVGDLLEYWRTYRMMNGIDISSSDQALYDDCLKIAARLSGKTLKEEVADEDKFLSKEFQEVSISALKLDGTITSILEERLEEISKCLKTKAPLACIFLCGSTLEGILLGVAANNPKKFNEANASPKRDGKVLPYHAWTLSNFIDVAKETGLINEDVKKFSHALRDFRNYIHPYEQASQRFNPDEHTAKLCWQVLRVAIFQIVKNQ